MQVYEVMYQNWIQKEHMLMNLKHAHKTWEKILDLWVKLAFSWREWLKFYPEENNGPDKEDLYFQFLANLSWMCI